MNKLTFGILIITFGFSLNGFSQLNDFDLTSYKLPDLERRALETNFNLYGYNNYHKAPSQTNNGQEEFNSNQYSGNIYLQYNHYLNNTEYQRESNMGIDFSSDFYNRKEDDELQYKNSNITPLLFYQRDNRKYYSEKSFIETNLIFNYQYDRNKRYSKNYWDDTENNDNLQTHTILASVPLKLGTGRIEQVQDARHAIYVFEELSKIERMNPDKTDEEILEFARLISQLKNERFFDSRLRKMAEIESVDSFFITKNYASEQDAKYFTTLSDFWTFGNRPIRNSGTRFSVAIEPGYYYYDFNNPGDGVYFDAGKYTLNSLLFNSGIELKHEKPINLFWQNSIDLNFHGGMISGKLDVESNSAESKIRIPNIQFGFFQTVGFYPNTRTDMNFGYSLQYVQLFDHEDQQNDILGVEAKGAKAATNLSINYYISPKFRLNISSSIYYIWQDSKDEVIINFDNVASSNYLLNNFKSNTNGYMEYFKNKEVYNSFRISLIYSIF